MGRIMREEYKQLIDLKIELERLREKELKANPKFKDKELLLNKMCERLIVAAADKMVDQSKNECTFEVK